MMSPKRYLYIVAGLLAGCRSTPPEAPRAYEAEAAANSLTGSARANTCRPCSGGRNIGYIGGPGDGVLRFNGVSAAREQDYFITFYYSNGSPSNLTAFVGHKDNSVRLIFPPSGGWMNIGSVTARVHLAAGMNSIEVYNHLGHFIADIDRIVVAPAPKQAQIYQYEAESTSNTFLGSAKPDRCAVCSGGGNVGYVGGPGYGVLQFNGVNVEHAGAYRMAIQYANGSPDPLHAAVCVNGHDTTSVRFAPTGGWMTLATATVPVHLKAGKNTIRFSNTAGYVADLDKITIQEDQIAARR